MYASLSADANVRTRSLCCHQPPAINEFWILAMGCPWVARHKGGQNEADIRSAREASRLDY